jgi:hypothetical protein
MDLLEQLDVAVGHVQALQRLEHLFEAGDGIVTCLRLGNHQQAAVNVLLRSVEASPPRVQCLIVLVLGLFGVGEVPLCIVELGPSAAEGRRAGGELCACSPSPAA